VGATSKLRHHLKDFCKGCTSNQNTGNKEQIKKENTPFLVAIMVDFETQSCIVPEGG
jgi:hypothetical protein